MGANKSAMIVPGKGTLFIADRTATFPTDPLAAFSLTGTPPTGWTNIGHTSKSNTASFSRDGGDKTVLDSWLQDAVEVIYAATNWGLTINSLQTDEDNLDLAFDGSFDADGGYIIPAASTGLEKQAFLLATDGTGKLGFWMENINATIGDAPSIDTANFFEIPLALSILAADPVKIPAAANGKPGIMKLYKSGITPSAPQISSLSQASGVAGSLIAINGSGFATASGPAAVKFGTENAASYIVNSDRQISATVPAGTAGSKPVTVTTTAGTSNAQPFTRS